MKKKSKTGARVLVAMSGGVDSSVAAALLMEQGYEPVGVTMKVWAGREERSDGCCSLSSIEDARRVAAKLGVPHYVMNVKEEFFGKVIKKFASEYLAGRTPNPCVDCNRHLKFGLLMGKARELGCKYVATGHYARIIKERNGPGLFLAKAKDGNKDQSYVLYSLSNALLQKVLFPLGNLTKPEVREKARALGLLVAEKEESQEICFVEDNDYAGFISRNFKVRPRPGDIVSPEGVLLGKHNGVMNYTIGQRRGLGLSSKEPLYVLNIDAKKNLLVAGAKELGFSKSFTVKELALNMKGGRKAKVKIAAKIRYKHKEQPATLVLSGKKGIVEFKKPQWAITPGQIAVFYQGSKVVGGGVIEKQAPNLKRQIPNRSKKDKSQNRF